MRHRGGLQPAVQRSGAAGRAAYGTCSMKVGRHLHVLHPGARVPCRRAVVERTGLRLAQRDELLRFFSAHLGCTTYRLVNLARSETGLILPGRTAAIEDVGVHAPCRCGRRERVRARPRTSPSRRCRHRPSFVDDTPLPELLGHLGGRGARTISDCRPAPTARRPDGFLHFVCASSRGQRGTGRGHPRRIASRR